MDLFYDNAFAIFERDGSIIVYCPNNHKMLRMPSRYRSLFEFIKTYNGRVSDNDRNCIAQMLERICNPEVIPFRNIWTGLAAAHFLYESQESLADSIADVRRHMDDVAFRPRAAYIHPTQRCNLSCWYCYNKTSRNVPELLIDVWRQILDKLKKVGVATVYVTGGEPFLREDIGSLLEHAIGTFSAVSVLSNGSMLTDAFINEQLHRLENIVISLDSIDADEHESNRRGGQHQHILDGLRRIKLAGLVSKIVIRTVITRQNAGSISRTRALLKEKFGIENYSLTRFLPNSPREVALVPSDEEVLGFDSTSPATQVSAGMDCMIGRCGAGRGIVAVNADGTIYPCQSFVGRSEMACGNILDVDWLEATERNQVRRYVANLCVDTIDACRGCDVRYLCGGGCPSIAERVYGSADVSVNFLCPTYRKVATNKLFAVQVEPVQRSTLKSGDQGH